MCRRADIGESNTADWPREQFRGLICLVRTVPWFHGERLRDTSHRTVRSIERRQLRGIKMAAIMSLDEPRPRGTLLGERVDRRRVREAEHFFRCKACNGWIDARDLVWVEDHEGELPHSPQDQEQ
jgi:hypothetical protein